MSEELLMRIQGASEDRWHRECNAQPLRMTASECAAVKSDDQFDRALLDNLTKEMLDVMMPETMSATDIATKAAELVGGDRDRQHGAKSDNFTRIATVWNAWLAVRKVEGPLDAHDVGCMMAMMKLARTQSGETNTDDYVDAAGYAACAGEVAQG